MREVARSFLAAEADSDYVRAMIEDERGVTDALWDRMVSLGWTGMLVPTSLGGSGLTCSTRS